jgi:hypothetical protein
MSPCHKDHVDKTAREMVEFSKVLKKYFELINRCNSPENERSSKRARMNKEPSEESLDRSNLFTEKLDLKEFDLTGMSKAEKKALEETLDYKSRHYYWRILSLPQSCVQDLHVDFAVKEEVTSTDSIKSRWIKYRDFYEEKFAFPFSTISFPMGKLFLIFN